MIVDAWVRLVDNFHIQPLLFLSIGVAWMMGKNILIQVFYTKINPALLSLFLGSSAMALSTFSSDSFVILVMHTIAFLELIAFLQYSIVQPKWMHQKS
jgi:hypothetical protein